MSDHDIPDMWWADESPVGTERRRNGAGSTRGGATDAAVDGLPGPGPSAGAPSGDAWPAADPTPRRRRSGGDPRDPAGSSGAPPGAWDVADGGPSTRHGAPDPGAPPARSGADLDRPVGYEPHDRPADPGRPVADPPTVAPRRVPEGAAPGRRPGAGAAAGLSPSDPLAGPERDPSAPRQWFVPPPDELGAFDDELPAPSAPVPGVGGAVPPAPVLGAGAPPARPAPARPRPPRIDRHRLAVVYDIEGPRIRLGVAWFVGALVATVLSPFTTALAFAVAAGFAGRQVVRAWGSVPWQADVAAGIAAVPVLGAVFGTPVAVGAAVLGLVVAIGAAGAPDGARLPGGSGRVAAAGIMALALVPALGGACMVLVRSHSVVAAIVLLGVASAYEVGDFIVGSGAGNPIEGPLAGITTATLVALPLSLVLVEPYDAGGVALLVFTAVGCPLGQIVASATLPGAGAPAPALRRIDTLPVLALIWAAAAAAF